METTVWGDSNIDFRVGYEDLLEDGDWDYNDFVVGIDITGFYIHNDPELVKLTFRFEALARAASYHHDLKFGIHTDFFGSSGAYTIDYYETDGSFISSTIGSFNAFQPLDLMIFDDTWNALPPTAGHPYVANGIDGTGTYPGRITIVSFSFTGFFAKNSLNLDTYTLDYIGVHGENLFFEPYLHVTNTGEDIQTGDIRFIVTPDTWIWPQESASIWTVYPYNDVTGEGVSQGRSPPNFTDHWYTETPTTNKWDP
jgi:LruC domain-containing protein